MSWIKDVFDSANNNKDPFIRFLFRLILTVVFIIISFLGYALIFGKKIIWNNGSYQIVDNPIVEKPAKVDSTKKDNSNLKPKSISYTTIKKDSISKTASSFKINPHRVRKPKITEKVFKGDLNMKDRAHIDKVINNYIGNMTKSKLAIGIFYIKESQTIECAYQLRRYLESKTFKIVHFIAYDDIEDYPRGFSLKYQPTDSGLPYLRIWIGSLNEGENPFSFY